MVTPTVTPRVTPRNTSTVTPRITLALTALALSHADSLYRAIDQHRAALQVWLDWVPSTQSLEDSRQFIRSAIALSAEKKGLFRSLMINGEAAGVISIEGIDPELQSGELGYWLSPSYWGHRVMQRAIKLLESEVKLAGCLARIDVRANVNNDRSIRVIRKSGYRLERRLRESEQLHGRLYDQFLFSKRV